jgi:SAM-dependent methyltransferase
MKVSELVAYKNHLDSLSSVPLAAIAKVELDKITGAVSTHNLQIDSLSNELLNRQTNIAETFTQFENDLNKLKHQLSEMIAEAEKPLFQQSYQQYEDLKTSINCEALYLGNVQQVLDRELLITEETRQLYLDRILRYTDWRYSGMILHPGRASFINHMVANDPLYIVDENYDLIRPAVEQFDPIYQNRLRISTVNEDADPPILKSIPDNQLGICVAYNFFNYKPFEVIKKYLEEIYQKLKPGGTLVMTFNDCDRYKAVILVEQFYASYTPGSMLRSWTNLLGFEEVFCHDEAGPNTWIELRKPGELTSLRGGQTLAKILPKPVA